MPGEQDGEDVLKYRYNGNFSGFKERPKVIFQGYGFEAKCVARGLEQLHFEKLGGRAGTANKQNPVGLKNPNREIYMEAAEDYSYLLEDQLENKKDC